MTKRKSLISVKETRRRLGNPAHSTIYKMFAAGQLTALKLAGRTMVDEDEVDQLIANPGLFNAHWTPLYERLTVGSMAAIQRARAMFSAPLARAMLST